MRIPRTSHYLGEWAVERTIHLPEEGADVWPIRYFGGRAVERASHFFRGRTVLRTSRFGRLRAPISFFPNRFALLFHTGRLSARKDVFT